MPSSEENWQEKLADELHAPIKCNFTRRRVITNHIDEIWASDLVEMQQFSKWNKGYRYLLMVIDVFSKYGWIVPLKDKKGESVTEAFKTIFKDGRKPQYLWVDKGKEFYNKHVKDLLEKNPRTKKPVPAPRKNVKQMVQEYEDNIHVIQPPLEFRDDYKPSPITKNQKTSSITKD